LYRGQLGLNIPDFQRDRVRGETRIEAACGVEALRYDLPYRQRFRSATGCQFEDSLKFAWAATEFGRAFRNIMRVENEPTTTPFVHLEKPDNSFEIEAPAVQAICP